MEPSPDQSAAQADANKHSLYNLEPTPEPTTEATRNQLRAKARDYQRLSKQFQEAFYTQPEYYVVSTRWLKRWKVYVGYNEAVNDLPANKLIGSGDLPQINQDILDPDPPTLFFQPPYQHLNVSLHPGLKQQADYQILSKPMWQLLLTSQPRATAVQRFLQTTLDGKKVEVYYRRVQAIVLFNEYLRDIEKQYVSEFKKVRLQLPQYRAMEKELVQEITRRVKGKVKGTFGEVARGVEFSDDPIKVWLVNEQLTEKQLLKDLYKACKSNMSYNYKLLLPGTLLPLTTPLEQLQLSPTSIVIFQLKQLRDQWVFFNKTHLAVAKCDNCTQVKQLSVFCSCNQAFYCSKECKYKDKSRHKYRCDREAESSDEDKKPVMTEKSRRGVMGLRNLGNTCFMNSGIQCVTSIVSMTNYFLSGKYLEEINLTNKIGTKGELSKAYGKLIEKMWYGTDQSMSPSVLKRAIGKFQPMFVGYDQHDSGELISYLLDGLHEDLNRVKDKPYTQSKDYDGRPDEILAKQAWQLFLKRNQSVVVDLMYGQYKSRLDCPKCQKISVTFDPFLMCPLPVPQNSSKVFQLRYLQHHVKNLKMQVLFDKQKNLKLQDIMDIVAKRLSVEGKMLANACSYYSSDLLDPKALANEIRKEHKHRVVLFRKVEPEEDLAGTRVNVQQTLCNSQYSNETHRRNMTRQRTYTFPNNTTAKQLHLTLWKYFNELLKVQDYQKQIIKAEPQQQRWRILLVAKSSYQHCQFCSKMGCFNCPLPFQEDITIEELAKKNKHFFKQQVKLEIQIYWRKDADEIEKIQERVDTVSSGSESGPVDEADVSIYDCFRLAEEPETLEEDNAWYCPSCKDFVLAKKQMMLYKAPKILIVYFKRFKAKGTRGLFKSKLTTLINFPIQNLDISKYVLNPDLPQEYFVKSPNPSSMKYQLFAISNHFGGLGGGHYTAYCRKNTEQWYEFDDSMVRPIGSERLVSSSSYVLFYRRLQGQVGGKV